MSKRIIFYVEDEMAARLDKVAEELRSTRSHAARLALERGLEDIKGFKVFL